MDVGSQHKNTSEATRFAPGEQAQNLPTSAHQTAIILVWAESQAFASEEDNNIAPFSASLESVAWIDGFEVWGGFPFTLKKQGFKCRNHESKLPTKAYLICSPPLPPQAKTNAQKTPTDPNQQIGVT